MAEKTKTPEEQVAEKVKENVKEEVKSNFETLKTELRSEYEGIMKNWFEGAIKTRDELQSELDSISEKTSGMVEEQVKAISDELQKTNEALIKQGKALRDLMSPEKSGDNKPIGAKMMDLLREKGAVTKRNVTEKGETEELEGIDYMKAKGIGEFKIKNGALDIYKNTIGRKAAVDMTTSNTYSIGSTPGVELGYVTDYAMRDVQLALTKDTHFMSVFLTLPTNEKYIGVFVEYSETDGSGITSEGSSPGQSSMKFKTVEFKVFDYSTYFRVHDNQWDDVPRLESRINRVVPDRLMSQIDEYTLYDSGDNSATPYGLRTSGYYTEFNPSTWGNEVESANEVDAISKMKLQAHLLNKDVNAVILHPSVIDKIRSLKDADRNDIRLSRLQFDNMGRLVMIDGLMVIQNKKMSTDEAIVLDVESVEYGLRKDLEVVVGFDGNDLTEGYKTIRFKIRAAIGLSDASKVIYSDTLAADVEVLNQV